MLPASPKVGKDEHIVARKYEVPILNQGSLGFCVPHGVIGILMLLRATRGLPLVRFSPLHLGWMSKNVDGTTTVDDGTYIRSCMSTLKATGVCEETLWPYKIEEFSKRPPLLAIENGYDHRIGGYERVPNAGRVDAVEHLIRNDLAVVFGTSVGNPFVDYDGSKDLVWQVPQHPIGAHCMYLDGVRVNTTTDAKGKLVEERQFRITNSWGTGWGQGGRAWMSETWLADPFTCDLWYATLPPT